MSAPPPMVAGVRALAEATGLPERLLRRYLEERRDFPAYRPPGGRTLMFDPAEVVAWIKTNPRSAEPPAAPVALRRRQKRTP